MLKINHIWALRRMLNPLSILQTDNVAPTEYILEQSVKPTIDYAQFVEVSAVIGSTSATITGTGWVTVWTCPDGWRERVTNINILRDSGTFTMTDVGILDTNTNRCIIETFSAAATKTLQPQDFIITGGQALQVYVDAHSVNGTASMGIKVDRALDMTPK